LERLKYLLAQGCKEGLVLTPTDWPGVQCAKALLDGGSLQGVWFDRSREYEARRQGKEYGPRDFTVAETVTLARMPCWEDLSSEEVRARVAELIRQVEAEARAQGGDASRSPRALRRLLQLHPHARPARSKRSPAPYIHAASKAIRKAFVRTYREFASAYREAAQRLRAGDRNVIFPPRCFLPSLPGRW